MYTTGITLHYFTGENKHLLKDVFMPEGLLQGFAGSVFSKDDIAEDAWRIIDAHRAEYGTGLGYLQDAYDNIIGLAGLQYLEDTQLFEVVCYMLPEYTSHTTDVVDLLVSEAFEHMSLDKVCARTIPGSLKDMSYRENAFVYIGERAFAGEGMDRIWNYYELANEGNLTLAGVEDRGDTDWDIFF